MCLFTIIFTIKLMHVVNDHFHSLNVTQSLGKVSHSWCTETGRMKIYRRLVDTSVPLTGLLSGSVANTLLQVTCVPPSPPSYGKFSSRGRRFAIDFAIIVARRLLAVRNNTAAPRKLRRQKRVKTI